MDEPRSETSIPKTNLFTTLSLVMGDVGDRAKLSSCCLLYSKNDTFDVQWHGALQVLEAGRQLALDIISGSKIDKL